MGVLTRGVRNAFRNGIRTVSIVLILGLSIGLALAMLVARAAVEDKITSLKSTIGTTITTSPAGARGFLGGGEPLTTAQMDAVAKVANVSKVSQTLADRLTTENTNLKTAIDAGSLGERGAANSGVGFMAAPPTAAMRIDGSETGAAPVIRTFTPPILVTGTNDLSTAAVFGGDKVEFTDGALFDGAKDEDVAVVGKELAEKNSLKVGSTFTAYGKTIKVVGIYDAGNLFANNGVYFQLAALQRLSDQKDSITSATATVNSVDNMPAAVTDVQAVLGNDADVTSNLESAQAAIEPLNSVKTIAGFSVAGALAAGAVIVLLTMVMIVRERRKEIGVFKAIGASNVKVMLQFTAEAVTLTVLAMVAGVIIGALAASPPTGTLVAGSLHKTDTIVDDRDTFAAAPGPGGAVRIEPGNGPGPQPGAVFRSNFSQIGGNTLENAKKVKASVGLDIIAYGAAAAFIVAALGSALPALFIAKIRPAEVMRAE